MTETTISRPVIATLLLTVFLDFLGFTIVLPYLYSFAQSINAPMFMYGLMVTAFAIMQLICAPIFGRLSDRYGRRTIIILSLVGSGVSYLMFGVSNLLWLVILSRLLNGAFSSTYPLVQAYVADVTNRESRLKYLGFVAGAYGLGYLGGPLLGGALSAAFGYAMPALFASLLAFSNALLAYVSFPKTNGALVARPTAPKPSFRRMFGQVNKERNLLLAINFASTLVFVLLLVIVPPWLKTVFNFGSLQTGVILSYAGGVSVVTVAVIIPRISKRFSSSELVLIGLAVIAINYLGLGLIRQNSSVALPLAIGMAGALSFGFSLVGPAVNSLISIASPSREQGQSLGVAKSTAGLAQVIAPSIATAFFTMGTSMGVIGLDFLVAMAITMTALPLVLLLRRANYLGTWEKFIAPSVRLDDSLLPRTHLEH